MYFMTHKQGLFAGTPCGSVLAVMCYDGKTTVTPVRGELDWIFQAIGIQRMQHTVTRRAVAGREVKAGCTQKWVKWAPSHLLHDAVNMTVYFLTIFLVTDVDAGKGEKKHLSLVRRLCNSRILFATSPRSDYISLNALRHIFLISGSSLLVWGNDRWFIFSKCHNKNFLISTLIEVA